VLYQHEARFAEAEPLFKRALSIATRVRGPEHPLTALYASNLANLYDAQGRYALAEPLHKRALAVAENSKNVDELLQGVHMVARQIEAALGRHQIVAIDAVGKPFDPNLHQAVQQVPTSEHPPMTVVQEVERGFTLKDRVVRPTTVTVAKAPEQTAPKKPASGEPKTGFSTEGE